MVHYYAIADDNVLSNEIINRDSVNFTLDEDGLTASDVKSTNESLSIKNPDPATGGSGGGAAGGSPSSNPQGNAATANTGSGGGGSGYGPAPVNIAGAGGSGIVMIRYKFQ